LKSSLPRHQPRRSALAPPYHPFQTGGNNLFITMSGLAPQFRIVL
jgi:hypothetical protein